VTARNWRDDWALVWADTPTRDAHDAKVEAEADARRAEQHAQHARDAALACEITERNARSAARLRAMNDYAGGGQYALTDPGSWQDTALPTDNDGEGITS
jgi:hypothetical protein